MPFFGRNLLHFYHRFRDKNVIDCVFDLVISICPKIESVYSEY